MDTTFVISLPVKFRMVYSSSWTQLLWSPTETVVVDPDTQSNRTPCVYLRTVKGFMTVPNQVYCLGRVLLSLRHYQKRFTYLSLDSPSIEGVSLRNEFLLRGRAEDDRNVVTYPFVLRIVILIWEDPNLGTRLTVQFSRLTVQFSRLTKLVRWMEEAQIRK